MPKGPEAQIQALILDYLRAKGILAYRMQTGTHIAEYKGRTRAIRYGVPGMADILAFRIESLWIGTPLDVSMPTWIECKAPKGKQSELQRSFQKQVEEQGHRYILARSLEDVMEVF